MSETWDHFRRSKQEEVSPGFGPGAKTGFNDENIKSLGLDICTMCLLIKSTFNFTCNVHFFLCSCCVTDLNSKRKLNPYCVS